MTKQASLNLVVLPGAGFIVQNISGGFYFLQEMRAKGWLGQVSDHKGSGAYLEGIYRLSKFIAYANSRGFEVTTSWDMK